LFDIDIVFGMAGFPSRQLAYAQYKAIACPLKNIYTQWRKSSQNKTAVNGP
jgi:hypothetical protein